MNPDDLPVIFIHELPHVMATPPGYHWLEPDQSPVPLNFACRRLASRSDGLEIAVAASENQVLVTAWVHDRHAIEHDRIFRWEDPELLPQLEEHVAWLARTWRLVNDYRLSEHTIGS